MSNKFGIILVKPQLGENIGACARSMKNFGFKRLNIVSPKFTFPNYKTKVTSVGAIDIINKAKIFQKVEDVINEFDMIISLSARKRDLNKRHITINDFLKILRKKKDTNFGLMFGPEASGLSNKDLSYSNYVLQIPTSKKFKSLNLSHSITLICYEIFRLSNKALFKKKGKNLKISSKAKILSFKFATPSTGTPCLKAKSKYILLLAMFNERLFIVKCKFSNEDKTLAPSFSDLGSKKILLFL